MRVFAIITLFFALVVFIVPIANGQESGAEDSPEEEPRPEFRDTEIRTRALELEYSEDESVIEIVIHRWGQVSEGQQAFTLSIESQPEFIENVLLEETTIAFNPDDWEKPLKLSFNVKEIKGAETGELREGELVLMINPDDPTLKPQERRFNIPMRYQVAPDNDGRTIFVTTLKEEFTGTSIVYETHLECTDEEVTLFVTDPIYIFFKGFPVEEQFFYKLIDPDGEEVETMPYSPGEDFGSGVLASLEGAISPMFKHFDEVEHEDGYDLPMKAGEYKVQVAYPQMKFDQVTGRMSFYGDFQEIGSFELKQPRLFYKGLLVKKTEASEKSQGFKTTMEASGGGKSASVQASWVNTFNGANTPMSASASVSYDLPDEIIWSRDQLFYTGSARLSGSTSGQEGVRKPAEFAVSSPVGYKIRGSVEELFEKKSPTASTRHRYISAPMGERTTSSVKGDRSSTPKDSKFELNIPNFFYPYGYPSKLMGWHLRDPNTLWSLNSRIELRGGVGPSGSVEVHAVYGPDPEGLSALPADPGSEDEVPEDEIAAEEEPPEEPDAVGDASTTQIAEQIQPTPDFIARNPVGGPGPAGSSRSQAGTGASSSGSGNSGLGVSQPVGDTRPAGPLVPARSQGGTAQENEQLEEALSTNNPEWVPPNHPRVTGFIEAWIGQAEPPANADPDVDLRYNEWGNLEGQAKGGVISQNYRPDEAVGLSSPEYLWGYRRDLDSLGHCQLGDWVMASLRGETLSGCDSRFTNTGPAPVPGVVGKDLDEAELEIVSSGLVPILEIGPPAPSPEEEGKISGQDPVLGSRIRKGDTVSIEVYTLYIGGASVPDLTGLSIDQAERVLTELGFGQELVLGDPASEPRQQDRIQKQEPAPDAQLEPYGTVTLWVYDQYVAQSLPPVPSPSAIPVSPVDPEPEVASLTVPDLSGENLVDVEELLSRMGLVLDFSLGDSARLESDENTVIRQSPQPGSLVNQGDVVKVWIYSLYIPKNRVPDLSGLSVDLVRSRLSEANLLLKATEGIEASNSGLSGKVYEQYPLPGAEIEDRGTVRVSIYSDYIEPVIAPNLVGIQANEAELIALERGLVVRVLKGPKAPSREKAFTIASQNPAPGFELEILDTIEVKVFGGLDSEQAPLPRNENESERIPSQSSSNLDSASSTGLFSPPIPRQLDGHVSQAGDAIITSSSFAGVSLWTGSMSEHKGIANPLKEATNRRPENGWSYLANEQDPIHAVSILYGKPGDENAIVFGLYWEESGDARSEEIKCGAPYESDFFWDDENWTMGRMNSSIKRAVVFFIGPSGKANECKVQLPDYLRQIERFARNCP